MQKGRQVLDQTIKDNDLMKLFGQMVGTEEPDPEIAIPKYERIHNQCSAVVALLKNFLTSPAAIVFAPVYPKNFEEIQAFVTRSEADLASLVLPRNDKAFSGAELNAVNADPKKLNELLMGSQYSHKIADLGERYKRLKSSATIQSVVVMTRNIKEAVYLEKKRRNQTRHDLEDKNNLIDSFIVHCDGETLELFPFSKLNFKALMLSDRAEPRLKGYILQVLHLIFVRCLDVVKDLTTPDIDVNKFSELMINSLGQLRRHIPRCDKAFDKIQGSVELMKNNFGNYYKDFISSQNPTIIAEHFLTDVAKSVDADAQTAYQFRQIASFYSKHVQNSGVKDPRVKKMLSMLSSNLDILDTSLDKKEAKETKDGGKGEKGAVNGQEARAAQPPAPAEIEKPAPAPTEGPELKPSIAKAKPKNKTKSK